LVHGGLEGLELFEFGLFIKCRRGVAKNGEYKKEQSADGG
jgi:hypothetical protein